MSWPAFARVTASTLLALCGALLADRASPQERVGEPRRADAARLMNDLMTGRDPFGGPFSLPDQRGRFQGPAQWRGKVVLMYFGYTFCPDVCPTDLSSIAAAIEALGADGAKVQPVFVTLDRLRDKPASDRAPTRKASIRASWRLAAPKPRSGKWRFPTRSSSRRFRSAAPFDM